ncbi:hypothetical protein Bca4012_020150 [Brassica carinata]
MYKESTNRKRVCTTSAQQEYCCRHNWYNPQLLNQTHTATPSWDNLTFNGREAQYLLAYTRRRGVDSEVAYLLEISSYIQYSL